MCSSAQGTHQPDATRGGCGDGLWVQHGGAAVTGCVQGHGRWTCWVGLWPGGGRFCNVLQLYLKVSSLGLLLLLLFDVCKVQISTRQTPAICSTGRLQPQLPGASMG